MVSDRPLSDRVWPKTGFWAASFRVMFPLSAIWAAVCVALWQWGNQIWPNLGLTLEWHIHEMVFGFGGAAVAGYLLTACSSWTGRAPVGGVALVMLASFWTATRVCLLLGGALAEGVAIVTTLGFFWGIAALLLREAQQGGKAGRPFFVAVCLAAGFGSAIWIYAMPMIDQARFIWPVLGCAVLLTVVGDAWCPRIWTLPTNGRVEPVQSYLSGKIGLGWSC
ncbi:NnrS family protein [Shimia sp.]|uniref:NnrS family protein n=1 Tax=Shimia sp. TaxID=1954381 RepID=UPI00329800F1